MTSAKKSAKPSHASKSLAQQQIRIRGAHHNNLKNLDLDLPTQSLIVVTGVSGSGKSTLAFDTIYAEGQRRYVETFSAYARQFLDRMDKPAVDHVDGIPPAIAIEQTNTVRTSRSTVGTMTELNDYLKLVFARLSTLYCPGCHAPVKKDSAEDIATHLFEHLPDGAPVMVCIPIPVPQQLSSREMIQALAAQGYTRIHKEQRKKIEVIQDRLRLKKSDRTRLIEAIEAALRHGQSRVIVYPLDEDKQAKSPLCFSSDLHCARCDKNFLPAAPGLFSFNSPVGACEGCRGFGRVIATDYNLVIPDPKLSLKDGAIKPFQTPSNEDVQTLLIREAKRAKIPVDVPWQKLTRRQQKWVIEGEDAATLTRRRNAWFGITGFFNWLSSKTYKMHVRVLLSKYRSYDTCTECKGARLKPQAGWWQLSTIAPGIVQEQTDATGETRLDIAGLQGLSIDKCAAFFAHMTLPKSLDNAAKLLLTEIQSRLHYLQEVGLGYLTLDRQSRTLSGGEVQRINLTTALGTSLVNTLFVLDEPSVGLHSRDVSRLVKILHRLRDAGNTLLVVEHDPQIMLAADYILDMGPGPGVRGGEISFFGGPAALLSQRNSLTAQYLTGKRQVWDGSTSNAPAATAALGHFQQYVTLTGVREHNLKDLTFSFPLRQLVCLVGVSGSGKSTLMRSVLYPALRQALGQPDGCPGAFKKLTGAEHISEVVLVDQSPIGKSSRSIPATVVGAFDAIRKLLSEQPQAKESGYKPGTFSFNAGTGRCPSCLGNGFEMVEMQFLSDVFLRCNTCQGQRYRPDVLAIKCPGASISTLPPLNMHEILSLTAEDAIPFFADHAEIYARLQTLVSVGLGYLTLGQPLPTLSGGEAQRLKLAAHLAETTIQIRRAKSVQANHSAPAPTQKTRLFLFDEPTTGLHFEDIKVLLCAFRALIDAGHSLLMIEHNLDVIQAADWLVEIGPGGGEAGGELITATTPSDLVRHTQTETAKALRAYHKELSVLANCENKSMPRYAGKYSVLSGKNHKRSNTKTRNLQNITIRHAREHNLKNIDVDIPRNCFTAVTGVSGSGKSTLAFDILFGEGQRRYLESLNAYARQFIQTTAKPDVDAIQGIPPTVAIEQRTSRGGYKSTVATVTEIYHYLRLLYVKLGDQYCPTCDEAISPQSLDVIVASILKNYRQHEVQIFAPMVVARKGLYKDLAAWASKQGFTNLQVDGKLCPTNDWPKLDRYKEHSIELPIGTVTVKPSQEPALREALSLALSHGKGVVIIQFPQSRRRAKRFSTASACPSCQRGFSPLDPRLFSFNAKHGWCTRCCGTGKELTQIDTTMADRELDELLESEGDIHQKDDTCQACDGQRLNETARAVIFRDYNISDLTNMTVNKAHQWFSKLTLRGQEKLIASDLLEALQNRLAFLRQVGLGYLTLDRAAPTLSGGEAQRIRLAAQLGSNLQGVCYILDEPTIGLHARDNQQLIETLKDLQLRGNTVVVVEHDEDTIRAADHIIDIGPRAGKNGGEVVATGTLRQVLKVKESVTGQCLAQPLRHPLPGLRDDVLREQYSREKLSIKQARAHNLKQINVEIPLRQLVCVTGVSGSGKSTLIRSVLRENLRAALAGERPADSLLKADGAIAALKPKSKSKSKIKQKPKFNAQQKWVDCDCISGWAGIKRVMEVDQTPIGKTPRSCPATYIGIWDDIRKRFAETVDARTRGFTASRFSFNTGEGRCAGCGGHGVQKVAMNFLPDVRVPCEACAGWRFNAETLTVRYKDKHIGDVLAMDVSTAVDFFSALPKVHRALQLMVDMGLGYLTLGQTSPTLSGGEAQRIKLVAELAKTRGNLKAIGQHHLYILDEPTVGLHMADVDKLIRVLHRLVDEGHSVIVIEHNLDVVAEADWVLDMGPEGGQAGGKVIAQGAPETLQKRKRSLTGQFLKSHLNN
jgi:excinuclease ABC subunit A